MKNYISVNAKHYKKKEINRISEHNFRLQKIGYLLPREHMKYENVNIIYANNITNKYENNLTKLGEYSQNLNEIYNKKQLDNILKSQYNHLLKTKEDIQYKNKSYAKANESTLVEMVVALSEEQAKAYLESGKDLGVGFDNFTKNLCEKYGFTPLQVSLHLDEGHVKNGVAIFNVHAHLTLFNFDFEKERSVLRTLKKQDYRDLQDMASLSFQEVGFDFVRGESKAITGNEHLEKNDHVIKKQNEEIKQQISELNQLKNDYKDILKKLEKGSEEYNKIFQEIGKLQQEEKQLRQIKKEIENIKSFKDQSKIELVELFKNNIKDSKVLDSKTFINDIYKLIHKNNNVNFKEVEEKDKIIKDKDIKINEQQEQINTLLDKLNQERNKNKVLEQDKVQIREQSKKAIELMDKQQKVLQRQIRANTRLKRQRQRLMQKIMKDNNLTKTIHLKRHLKTTPTKTIKKDNLDKNIDFDR